MHAGVMLVIYRHPGDGDSQLVVANPWLIVFVHTLACAAGLASCGQVRRSVSKRGGSHLHALPQLWLGDASPKNRER